MQNGQYAAGVSYDMRKCFDSIPLELILQLFNFRGADTKVTCALTGFYSQHTSHIIQNSLINVWQAHLRQWYGTDNKEDDHTVVPGNPVPNSEKASSKQNVAVSFVFDVVCKPRSKNMPGSNKPCKFPDLDSSHWLTVPGMLKIGK